MDDRTNQTDTKMSINYTILSTCSIKLWNENATARGIVSNKYAIYEKLQPTLWFNSQVEFDNIVFCMLSILYVLNRVLMYFGKLPGPFHVEDYMQYYMLGSSTYFI